MKSIIRRSSGFFLATCFPLIYWHLAKLPTLAEALDGLVSSFAFSLPFALGLGIVYVLFPFPRLSHAKEWGLGLLSAALMWTFIALFWVYVPQGITQALREYALWGHMSLSLIIGLMVGLLPRKDHSIVASLT